MRLCKPCGEFKPLDQFNKDKNEKDGIRYYCKACAKVRKAAYLQRKNMNEVKRDSILRSQSVNVRKIFEATPIQEAWNAPSIAAEMRRLGTGGNDSRHVLGCLNSLCGYGLVVEGPKGSFKRAEVHIKPEKQPDPVYEAPVKPQQKETIVIKATAPAKNESTPIDRLSSFAIRLRALADEMENTALDLAEKAEKNESETAKMRQLQALLKSLG